MSDDKIVRLQQRVDEQIALQVDPPGQPMPNARRFVAEEYDHQERVLLVHQGGQFYTWDGTCWPSVDDGHLRARLYEFFEHKVYEHENPDGTVLKPFAPNRYKVADLVDALRGVTHTPLQTPTPSWLSNTLLTDRLPADELVACSNGLVHVPTRMLYSHTPNYYTHHSVPFDFDADAPRPERWLGFLEELWPGDQESVDTLQEVFGYLVAGDTRQQKMFLLVGPKRSGKGTIARILKALIGAHNVAGPTLASLGTNFGLSPLIGKPVAIVADARLKASDNSIVTERLLSISGEDTLTVDRKYKEPWTGQLPARVLILSNELPRLTDSSGALASRFIVLTMTTSFYGRENPNLTAELSIELPGIFLWALDGLERLRDRGRFVQPAASQEAIRELEDLGSPVGAFIRDECVVGPEYTVSCDLLYEYWKGWCEGHGRHATNAQIFGRDLRAAYPAIRRTQPRNPDGTRYSAYQGIALARSGTRATTLYCQQPEPTRSSEYIAVARVPSRANADLSRSCPDCNGSGCDTCGEWKDEGGNEL